MTRFVLDTNVLIAYLRGTIDFRQRFQNVLRSGHTLATTCVNVAEVVAGVLPRDRAVAEALLDRLTFLPTTGEAAIRAGRYQQDFRRRGRTIHTPDALIAGTVRVHGAILITDNVEDFPMSDLRVERP